MTAFNNRVGNNINGDAVRSRVLALFLGSLVISSLIPIYYFFVKRDRGQARCWAFHEDRLDPLSPVGPRGKIRPVRGEGVVCQICMGKLKAGLPSVDCECGRTFHITCLKRTGFCPYCQKAYSPEEVEERATYPELESMECPICGRTVLKDSGVCECGAIIADEDGVFYCPICGTQMDEGEVECPYCHELFEEVKLVLCPSCGRMIDEKKGVCECGLFLGEVCPECGVRLSPEDRCCPSCGIAFEMVGDE